MNSYCNRTRSKKCRRTNRDHNTSTFFDEANKINQEPFPSVPEPIGTATDLPWLRKQSKHRRAATAAMFYGEAFMNGISISEANTAASNTKACYSKWWLQERFDKSGIMHGKGQDGDSKDYKNDMNASEDTNKSFVNAESSRSIVSSKDMKRKSCDKRKRTFSHEINKFTCSESQTKLSLSLATDSSKTFQGDYIVERSEKIVPVDSNIELEIKETKTKVLEALKISNGCTKDSNFLNAVSRLESLYKSNMNDRNNNLLRKRKNEFEAVWLNMSNPSWQECLGRNENGDYIYTLGRMSFDMFRPADLRCSIQGVFNTISATTEVPSAIPSSLCKEIHAGAQVRTYK